MNAPLPDLPDEHRGYFMTREIAAALHAHRAARLDDFHARAAAGDLLLTDIPEEDRWAVRFRHALAADPPHCSLVADPRPMAAIRVAWPAGHGDPFAGRPDDVLTDADTLVRFVTPPAGELPRWETGERDRLLGLDADPAWTALDERPIDTAEFMEALGYPGPAEGAAPIAAPGAPEEEDPFSFDGFPEIPGVMAGTRRTEDDAEPHGERSAAR